MGKNANANRKKKAQQQQHNNPISESSANPTQDKVEESEAGTEISQTENSDPLKLDSTITTTTPKVDSLSAEPPINTETKSIKADISSENKSEVSEVRPVKPHVDIDATIDSKIDPVVNSDDLKDVGSVEPVVNSTSLDNNVSEDRPTDSLPTPPVLSTDLSDPTENNQSIQAQSISEKESDTHNNKELSNIEDTTATNLDFANSAPSNIHDTTTQSTSLENTNSVDMVKEETIDDKQNEPFVPTDFENSSDFDFGSITEQKDPLIVTPEFLTSLPTEDLIATNGADVSENNLALNEAHGPASISNAEPNFEENVYADANSVSHIPAGSEQPAFDSLLNKDNNNPRQFENSHEASNDFPASDTNAANLDDGFNFFDNTPSANDDFFNQGEVDPSSNFFDNLGTQPPAATFSDPGEKTLSNQEHDLDSRTLTASQRNPLYAYEYGHDPLRDSLASTASGYVTYATQRDLYSISALPSQRSTYSHDPEFSSPTLEANTHQDIPTIPEYSTTDYDGTYSAVAGGNDTTTYINDPNYSEYPTDAYNGNNTYQDKAVYDANSGYYSYDTPSQQYDPNYDYSHDPNAASNEGNYTYDPNGSYVYDSNTAHDGNYGYDPNPVTESYDYSQNAAVDPNYNYDPNAYDPNATTGDNYNYDPNAYDPNSYDPNTTQAQYYDYTGTENANQYDNSATTDYNYGYNNDTAAVDPNFNYDYGVGGENAYNYAENTTNEVNYNYSEQSTSVADPQYNYNSYDVNATTDNFNYNTQTKEDNSTLLNTTSYPSDTTGTGYDYGIDTGIDTTTSSQGFNYDGINKSNVGYDYSSNAAAFTGYDHGNAYNNQTSNYNNENTSLTNQADYNYDPNYTYDYTGDSNAHNINEVPLGTESDILSRETKLTEQSNLNYGGSDYYPGQSLSSTAQFTENGNIQYDPNQSTYPPTSDLSYPGNTIPPSNLSNYGSDFDNGLNLDDLVLGSKPTAFTPAPPEMAASIPLPLSPESSRHLPASNKSSSSSELESRHGRPPCGLFHFGFSGKIFKMLPKTVERFSTSHSDAVTKVYPDRIHVESMNDIPGAIPMSLSGSKQGPLRTREQVEEVITQSIQTLESDIHSGHAPENSRDTLLLWKILDILLKNGGVWEGTNESISSILKSEFIQASTPTLPPLTDIQPNSDLAIQLRQLLLQGSRQDAARLAVQQGAWGHALIIASCAGKETWQETVQSFTRVHLAGPGWESLSMAYSLFAGLGKNAVKEVAGRGDWYEKLALILSNRTTGDGVALCTLGDELLASGLISAAHVCYLLSPGVSIQGGLDAVGLRMVLVNTSMNSLLAHEYDGIRMTEVLEFALNQRGSSHDAMPFFQAFKLSRAWALVGLGRLEEAIQYCEAVTEKINPHPSNKPYYHECLRSQLASMADRIKYTGVTKGSESAAWLTKRPTLGSIMNAMEGHISQLVMGESDTPPPRMELQPGPTVFRSPVTPNHLFESPGTPFRRSASNERFVNNSNPFDIAGRRSASPHLMTSPFAHNMSSTHTPSPLVPDPTDGLFSPMAGTPLAKPATPVDSAPATINPSPISDDVYEDHGFGNSRASPKPKKVDPSPSEPKDSKPQPDSDSASQASSSGVFGSIWSSFFGSKSTDTKPVYKAKLGEENSFVFDPELKRWVNKAAGATPPAPVTPPPPPRSAPRTPTTVTPPASTPPAASRSPVAGGAPPPPGGPTASRPKKGAKNRYVDIFN